MNNNTFAKPPHVMMNISDDRASTDFGFVGHGAIKTPHLGDRRFSGKVDPHETKNLAGQKPDHVEKLEAQIKNWWDGKS